MSRLEFNIVSKNFSQSGETVEALKKVSFDVNSNEIVGLIGRNGAGKTTAIKISTGFISEFYGSVLFDSEPINSLPADQCALSYIPDSPVYYEFMTLLENLRFVSNLYPDAEDYSVNDLVELFDLESHLNKMPNQLSKGTKQKLSICMALLRRYKILLADEPFSGLDPSQINALKKLFLNLSKEGKGVLISTHLLDVVESFCDRYIVLDRGKVLAEGTKEQLIATNELASMPLEDVFLQITSKDGLI